MNNKKSKVILNKYNLPQFIWFFFSFFCLKSDSFEILLACSLSNWIGDWLASVNEPNKATNNFISYMSFYVKLKPTGLQNNLTFNQGRDSWFVEGRGWAGGFGKLCVPLKKNPGWTPVYLLCLGLKLTNKNVCSGQ